MEEIAKHTQNLTQNRRKKFNVGLALLFSVSLALPAMAQAASLYFSPSSGNYHEGENFTISIKVETNIAINAVEGVFSFPTRYLEVARINKSNSVINLWTQEPSFSNIGDFGNVSFEGVILNPGFIGPAGEIIDVVLRVKGKGVAELNFLKMAILVNDGFGTNITTLNGGAKFILLAAKVQPKEEKIPSEPGVQPQVIVIKETPQALPQGIESAINLWNNLPSWFKASVVVLVGIAILISSLILFSFGLIILIYLWKYALSKREVVLKRLELVLKLFWHTLRRTIRKVLIWLRISEEEFEGDIKYSFEQLKTEFKEVASFDSSPLPPFIKVIKSFWLSIGKIIKRFFTRNIPPSGLDNSDSGEKNKQEKS
jgi:hypothetical protein